MIIYTLVKNYKEIYACSKVQWGIHVMVLFWCRPVPNPSPRTHLSGHLAVSGQCSYYWLRMRMVLWGPTGGIPTGGNEWKCMEMFGWWGWRIGCAPPIFFVGNGINGMLSAYLPFPFRIRQGGGVYLLIIVWLVKLDQCPLIVPELAASILIMSHWNSLER